LEELRFSEFAKSYKSREKDSLTVIPLRIMKE